MSLHMKIKLHEKLRALVPFKRGSHFIFKRMEFPPQFIIMLSINYPALSKEQISFMHIPFQVKCLYKYINICKYEDLVIPKWYQGDMCL